MDERRGAFGGARDGFFLGRDGSQSNEFQSNVSSRIHNVWATGRVDLPAPSREAQWIIIIIHLHPHCAFHRSTANCPPKKR